jgi:hypothetical protein
MIAQLQNEASSSSSMIALTIESACMNSDHIDRLAPAAEAGVPPRFTESTVVWSMVFAASVAK